MITEFPLLVFTVLASIAAGLYVAAALFYRKGEDARCWLLPVLVIVLAGVGGLASTTHLGRPANILNIMNNPTASLTMEGIMTGLLALVALVDAVICFTKKASMRGVRIVGAVVGVLLLCVITYAYVTSYGNPAWIATPSYLLFVIAGLAAGFALWEALCGGCAGDKQTLVTAILASLFALVLVWQAVVFSGLGEAGFGPIVAGAVCAVAAAACAFWASRRPAPMAGFAWIVAVLVVVALVASRYGFYMASII